MLCKCFYFTCNHSLTLRSGGTLHCHKVQLKQIPIVRTQCAMDVLLSYQLSVSKQIGLKMLTESRREEWHTDRKHLTIIL